jgi:hypothetical protein
MALTPRQQKKRQMVRTGYAGLGAGALIVLISVGAQSIILGVIGIIVLAIGGWATRALRSL